MHERFDCGVDVGVDLVAVLIFGHIALAVGLAVIIAAIRQRIFAILGLELVQLGTLLVVQVTLGEVFVDCKVVERLLGLGADIHLGAGRIAGISEEIHLGPSSVFESNAVLQKASSDGR